MRRSLLCILSYAEYCDHWGQDVVTTQHVRLLSVCWSPTDWVGAELQCVQGQRWALQPAWPASNLSYRCRPGHQAGVTSSPEIYLDCHILSHVTYCTCVIIHLTSSSMFKASHGARGGELGILLFSWPISRSLCCLAHDRLESGKIGTRAFTKETCELTTQFKLYHHGLSKNVQSVKLFCCWECPYFVFAGPAEYRPVTTFSHSRGGHSDCYY